ncbi:MAG TPA: metalloprotease TldD [Blastocatellia bacterium]|nr:metalloprotease TldD [Blastocatellia bacterium]HMY72488.1 metalloprotease TldD [Blastocatellia bacterium]HNG29672.1 metalloprotease TldD [Blastocatellia bacterium]
MIEPIKFFTDKFNIAIPQIESLLGAALSKGGEYADLYFEHNVTNNLNLEEQIIKSANRAVKQGVGVRVISGERTGFAYCDEISVEAIRKAAVTAAHIAHTNAQVGAVNVSAGRPQHDLYAVADPLGEQPLERKIELLNRIDRTARNHDPRIREVQAGVIDEYKVILIATSEGKLIGDVQPLVRMRVNCIADDDGNLQSGVSGGGGRVGIDYFNDAVIERYATEAARQAIVQLEATDAPAGAMEVVLGSGWPGILLHEAVGHGLEADFNRKGTSAFSGLIGQKVASELCTVVDEGSIPNRRGSLNVDDEGTPTSRTVLIENGILRGYMQDKLSTRLTGAALTGNGRRESYRHLPMPRMTNTFMLNGQSAPEDIIKSVKRGLYAVQFGGGQVDITNGKFVFSASEAYLIEDGQVTAPVKGATLIGNGPISLTKVTAVGNDLALDEGLGTCGKDGQGVPVGVGMPTIKISEMTVGGTKG